MQPLNEWEIFKFCNTFKHLDPRARIKINIPFTKKMTNLVLYKSTPHASCKTHRLSACFLMQSLFILSLIVIHVVCVCVNMCRNQFRIALIISFFASKQATLPTTTETMEPYMNPFFSI